MSRLVINKTEDRVICIIKNFASIELDGNKVKIIDKYGLSETSIFSLQLDGWCLKMKGINIMSSNKYAIHTYDDKVWYVSSAALSELESLFRQHHEEQLSKCILSGGITLEDMNINYLGDGRFHIEKDGVIIEDKLMNMMTPENFFDVENVILGSNSYIYVAQHKANTELKRIFSDPFGMPANLYSMVLNKEYINMLKTFITRCLSTHTEEVV